MWTNEEIDDLEKLLTPKEKTSVIALLNAGFSENEITKALLSKIGANYNGDKGMAERPLKEKLDLSNYYTVPVNENDPDGEVEIFDEGAYEDETKSILKRLEVFKYKQILVTEEVAAALLDKNPECFKDCPDFKIINGEQTTKDKQKLW